MPTVAKTSIQINTAQATHALQNLNVGLNVTLAGFEGLERALKENTKALRQARTAGNNYHVTQKKINSSVSFGHRAFVRLRGSILSVVGAYASLQAARKFMDKADEYINTQARFENITGGAEVAAQMYDRVYQSAQRSRGSVVEMASAVGKLGINAKHAFNNTDEMIAFVETFQKAGKVSGQSQAEMSNALYQMTQALASGKLQGDELRSVRENAPRIYQAIVRELENQFGKGVDLQKVARDGLISSKTIKAAVLKDAEKINSQFKNIPMTFGDYFQQAGNKISHALQPIFKETSKIINNPAVKNGINQTVNFAVKGIYWVWGAIKKVGSAVGWVIGVFDKFKWAIAGVVAAMALYKGVALVHIAITKTIAFFTMLAGAIKLAYAGYVGLATIAVTGLTQAQVKLMFANIKIVAIILIIIAVLAAIVYWLDYITGAVYWCGAAFTNVWLWVCDVFSGAWANMKLTAWQVLSSILEFSLTVAEKVANAFVDAFNGVAGFINGIVDKVGNTALGKKLGISGLKIQEKERVNLVGSNKLLQSWKANESAARGEATRAAISTPQYKSLSAAWDKGFKEGGSLRDDGLGYIKDKVKGLLGFGSLDMDALKSGNISGIPSDVALDKMLGTVGDPSSFGSGDDAIKKALGDIADNTKQTADNTGKDDNYELLRDVMRQRAISRVGNSGGTVKIDMVNNNSLSSKLDIKSFLEQLAKTMEDAASTAAKGVHL